MTGRGAVSGWRSVAFLAGVACAGACTAGDARPDAVVWRLDNLDTVGGQALVVAGDPRLIDTPGGKAVEFDGLDDGLFVDVNPLAGLAAFTVEVVFRPDRGGPDEQRFVHFQEDASESRLLFETRLVDDGYWFLDTYSRSGEQSAVLYAEDDRHALGDWTHAAIVMDGARMRHYVDGQLELAADLSYTPQAAGRSSLGVRLNRVSWFKGAIRTLRFTPAVLDPGDFLTARD